MLLELGVDRVLCRFGDRIIFSGQFILFKREAVHCWVYLCTLFVPSLQQLASAVPDLLCYSVLLCCSYSCRHAAKDSDDRIASRQSTDQSSLIGLLAAISYHRTMAGSGRGNQVEKAEQYIAEGEKVLKKWTLFSSTSKNEDAAEWFDKAAKSYKVRKLLYTAAALVCGPCGDMVPQQGVIRQTDECYHIE